ncbi:MAG: triose-phosphate isomerase [Minisyncoccia bacterium]
MSKLVVANWKMNPASLREAVKLAKACDKKGTVIAPPFVFLEEVGRTLKKAALGAQNVSYESAGAHTGDISVRQLKSLGVKYAIIGHSERRASGETDAVINKKIKAALAGGLKVILCVGEKWSIRKKGIAAAKKFAASQFKRDLEGIISSNLKAPDLIIAYEPVWAISTGKNDNPENASEMAIFIKKQITLIHKSKGIKVLYGGSVNAKNARSFLKAKNIDGLLVGGASLSSKEFGKIIKLNT